jgi:putative addiction module CopG family antidote
MEARRTFAQAFRSTVATYPPELASYVQSLVASGRFNSEAEFAVEAARVYRELEQKHQALRSDIEAAIAELESGQCDPLDIDSIKQQLLAR